MEVVDVGDAVVVVVLNPDVVEVIVDVVDAVVDIDVDVDVVATVVEVTEVSVVVVDGAVVVFVDVVGVGSDVVEVEIVVMFNTCNFLVSSLSDSVSLISSLLRNNSVSLMSLLSPTGFAFKIPTQ